MGSKKATEEKKEKKKNKSASKRGESSDVFSEQAQKRYSNAGGKKKVITDARFSSVHSDPRFQNVPKHKSKVAIDSRFDRMFSDKRFSTSSAPLDKRGKPKKKDAVNPLRHYYQIEEEKEKQKKQKREMQEEDSDDKLSDEDEELESDELGFESEEDTDNIEVKRKGKNSAKLDSSSELEHSESEDGDTESAGSEYATDTDEGDYEDIYEEEVPGMPVENIPEIDKETRRLAVVNMDWRYVKAVDLLVILRSFLPKDGQILSVAIYPSEFGLKRMKEEEVHGPVGLFDDKDKESDEDDEDEIDNEKLRGYEMNRLRYYFAVVECDSIATADYLYRSCDGVEFERSSNVLDLRFIPDSMEFKHPPKDVATEAPSNYEAVHFHTAALQHSRIHLSWDEDEPQRVKALKRNFNADQLADMELKEFLASDESEGDDDSGNLEIENGETDKSNKKKEKADKYRALLQSGTGFDEEGEQEDGQDMEVTFNTGLEDISKRILEKKDKKSETVWEAYLRKRLEKRKARKDQSKHSSEDESSDTDQEEAVEEQDDFFIEEPPVKRSKRGTESYRHRDKQQRDADDKEAVASRAELELLFSDEEGSDDGIEGYNLKHNKAKGKMGSEVLDEDKIPAVDYDDPRFSRLFTSPLFAMDPTDPTMERKAKFDRLVAKKEQKGEGKELQENQHIQLPPKVLSESAAPQTNKDEPEESEIASSKKEKYELSSLVRSIKSKSKQIQLPSSGKNAKKDRKRKARDTEEKEEKNELPASPRKAKKKKKSKKTETKVR